jgi:SAM-dependent methyltransferase
VAADRDLLRQTFDTQAERYDRARPHYPAGLVACLAERAGLGPGRRVLEIAPGTGQLTVPLAGLGCEVTAVELGPALAAVARRNLARFPRSQVIVSAFEDWPLPAEPFDAVACATALHWFDPAAWTAKVAGALRPGGWVATVATHHVAGGATPAFAVESQACYERWDPGTTPGFRLPTAAEVPRDQRDLDESGRFGPVAFHRYQVDVAYTAGSFVDTQLTYSSILSMEPAARDGLLGCLAALIDARFGGRIVKRYLFELRLAQRTS